MGSKLSPVSHPRAVLTISNEENCPIDSEKLSEIQKTIKNYYAPLFLRMRTRRSFIAALLLHKFPNSASLFVPVERTVCHRLRQGGNF